MTEERRFGNSRRHMVRAREVMPRGVSSSKRASQRPTPVAFVDADGSHLRDADGNDYVDYVAGFGPMLLGHRHPAVLAAVAAQLRRGVLFGGQHAGELELAERITALVPSAERVMLFSSGSEAVHAALGLARGATGRRMVVKFEGHYHGWISPMPVNMPGTAPGNAGVPGSAVGVAGWPPSDDVLVCPWNDPDAIDALLDDQHASVAAVIMEPVGCNAGTLPPQAGYLGHVRARCDRHGIALVFDEVITGFRLALGGAQQRFGVTPDITVLGKALGSGFPISAVAATTAVSECAATGPVEMRGTYNGSPVSAAAANAVLDVLARGRDHLYPLLEQRSADLAAGLSAGANLAGAPAVVNRVGSALSVLWGTPDPTVTYRDVAAADAQASGWFGEALLQRGVHTIDGEKWYVSTAHTAGDIEATIAAASEAFVEVMHRIKERA